VSAVWVVLGAAFGAPLRYLTDRYVQSRHDSQFPWGTFTVNVAGSFLLGLIAAGFRHGGVSTAAMTLLGTGFCGALTTYSTFSYETVRLLQRRSPWLATANAGLSIVAGLAAAYLGLLVARLWWAG
jgi:CrcB protein